MNTSTRPDLAHRLIVRAARQAPAALTERLAEEWLADLASRTGAGSRLRLAIGCCWATGVITRDFRVPQLAASSATGGHKPLRGDFHYDLPQLSRRTVTFILIVALHALLIYGFASGFGQRLIPTLPAPMHGVVIEEIKPQLPPPQVTTDVRLTAIRPTAIPVVGPQEIDFPPDTDPTGTRVTQPPSLTQPEPPVRPVTRVAGGPGKGFPDTQDYYPSAARRAAETGVSNVQVCVDVQGRLTAEPTLAQSSGNRRLDDAALNLAKAGSGHYRPTTEDGQAVSACFPYRIRFALSN
jgi:TonB family protein